MCGIAGIVGNRVRRESVERMVESLRHRGPDDSGVECIVAASLSVALGSTRLAIIDPSPAGHMPMEDPETGSRIVYNGEIYNFPELKRELEAKGERFRSATDTEVVLRAYKHWGRDCVGRFRGMFAFAIWDPSGREMFLARDRIGKKPLYYHLTSSGEFLFASELRALMASGLVGRRLNPAALEEFLFNGFVIAPRTMLGGVHSLLPGHAMRVATDGGIVEVFRYARLPDATSSGKNITEAQEDIRERLEEAVRLRLVSDVPIGAFLSGGLDSSAIVALMARASSDVRTFSVTFDESEYDESPYSRWVAERFQTNHTDVRLRQKDFEGWLPDTLAAMDHPTFDGVNTYCVSRAAREAGLTVTLSGLGGDELFGGYPFFGIVPRLHRLAQFVGICPQVAASFVRRRLARHPLRLAGPWKTLELFERSPVPRLLAAYQTAQILFPLWTRGYLLDGDLALGRSQGDAFGLPAEFQKLLEEEIDSGETATSVISKLALRLFLGERCLRDTDTMSMGVSLEVRAPFTDQEVISAAWGAPAELRCQGAPNKPFLWQIVKPYLGESYPLRKKQGFEFPFEQWLRQGKSPDLIGDTLSNEGLAASIGFNSGAIRALLASFHRRAPHIPWSRVWALFVLLQWCGRHRVAL